MKDIKVQIKFDGKEWEKTVPEGTTLLELSREFDTDSECRILAAKMEREIEELFMPVTKACTIEFLTGASLDGYRILERALSFIFVRAANEVFGKESVVKIEHSLDKGLYCEIEPQQGTVNAESVAQVQKVMREIVELDDAFEKHTFPLEEAKEILKNHYHPMKIMLLNYRTKKTVNMYKCGWLWDYFYGALPPSTGYTRIFELRYQEPGIILRLPNTENPRKLPEFKHDRMMAEIFRESKEWNRLIGVPYVAILNRAVEKNRYRRIIQVSEALHEKKIIEIADTIKKMGKRVVLIAGPSSSGKTSFAQRLSVQLNVLGLKACAVSTDDYFIDREFAPRDEKGNYRFEDLDALDVDLFNRQLNDLLSGRETDIPIYNFITGVKEFGKRITTLDENEIMIVEGIHGLNDALSNQVRHRDKFKIYISPFTALGIDGHNRIPTTDARLFRRIVRDHRTRGASAQKTIRTWPDVRAGEEKNIFPFQEEADVMFNTALPYELAVLKKYCQPLLDAVGREEEEFTEAKRLSRLLSYFVPIEDESTILNHSILKEFIGGSCLFED